MGKLTRHIFGRHLEGRPASVHHNSARMATLPLAASCCYAPRHSSARRLAKKDSRRVATAAKVDAREDDVVDVDLIDATMRTRRAFLTSVSLASALGTVPSTLANAAELGTSPLAEQLVDAKATRVLETGLGAETSTSSLSTSITSSPTSITIPMRLDRAGTYVVEYTIGTTTVRGVLDTGSPFITMESNCSEVWGCLNESDARRSGFDDTYEIYGLQEDGVTRWVLGDVTFKGVDRSRGSSRGSFDRGTGSMNRLDTTRVDVSTSSGTAANTCSTATIPTTGANLTPPHTTFSFPELSFGITSETVGRAGSAGGGVGSAPFVGLVKQRKDWIRPTFLEQTDIKSFYLDFDTDTLTLSRTNLIASDRKTSVFPLVDLRPLGAPVFHYAVKVDELWINGGKYRPSDGIKKPIYAVFDSGVTGALVSKQLFYDSDFQFGTFESHVRVKDEDGNMNSIGTSLQTCTGRCLFLALPVDVQWVGFEECHVLFLGLAFMYGKGGLVVDIDDERVTLGKV